MLKSEVFHKNRIITFKYVRPYYYPKFTLWWIFATDELAYIAKITPSRIFLIYSPSSWKCLISLTVHLDTRLSLCEALPHCQMSSWRRPSLPHTLAWMTVCRDWRRWSVSGPLPVEEPFEFQPEMLRIKILVQINTSTP